MKICWRCKKSFEPIDSCYYPNIKECCQPCADAVFNYMGRPVPEKLLVDVSPEVEEAEKIIGGQK